MTAFPELATVPQAEPEPRPPTISDQIWEIGSLVKTMSKNLAIPIGTAFQIAELGLNYSIAQRQLAQRMPPILPTDITEEPSNDEPSSDPD